jgi:hypothetical protein
MKIAVCLPSFGFPHMKFVISLTTLLLWSQKQEVTINGEPIMPEFLIVTAERMPIDTAREFMSEQALAAGADYLFWLDDDQIFPKESLFRLMAHDLPVVGANYPRRTLEAKVSSAANWDGDKIVPIEPKSEGLEEVDGIGFGCALMKASVFAGLPNPWFRGGTSGEDAQFFGQLAKHGGIRPVVDHGLKVDHIDQRILSF